MITIAVPSSKESLASRAYNFLVPIWQLRLRGIIARSRRDHIARLLSYSTSVHVSYALLRQQLRAHKIYQRNQKLGMLRLHQGRPKQKHSHQRKLFSTSQPAQRMDCRPPIQNKTHRNTSCNTSLQCTSSRPSELSDLMNSCNHKNTFAHPCQACPNATLAFFLTHREAFLAWPASN